MKPATVKALVLSPIVLLLFTAVRLLLISNYNVATAGTLVASGGTVGTLMGTLLPLLPTFLPVAIIFAVASLNYGLAFVLALGAAIVSPAFGRPSEAYPSAVQELEQVWLALKTGDISPYLNMDHLIFGAMIAVTLWVALSVLGEVEEEAPKKPEPTPSAEDPVSFMDALIATLPLLGSLLVFIASLIFSLLVGIAAYGAIGGVFQVPNSFDQYSNNLRRPWFPIENIGLTNGEVMVGYVVSSKDGWTLLLQERDRITRYVKPDTIVARRACRTSDLQPFKKPILKLSDPPAYIPLCRAVPVLGK